jgi:hypothetical protein
VAAEEESTEERIELRREETKLPRILIKLLTCVVSKEPVLPLLLREVVVNATTMMTIDTTKTATKIMTTMTATTSTMNPTTVNTIEETKAAITIIESLQSKVTIEEPYKGNTAITMMIIDVAAKETPVGKALLATAFQLIRRSRISNSRMSSAMTRLSQIDTARLKITESSISVMLVPDPTKELILWDIQTPTPVDAVWTTPGPNSAKVRPPNAQVTASRPSTFVDPSPLPRAVPEAAAKRRSKPPMVLVPTTTRRSNVSATLATMMSAATKSGTAEISQWSAPAQTTATARSATTAKRAALFAMAEDADNAERMMSTMKMMTVTTAMSMRAMTTNHATTTPAVRMIAMTTTTALTLMIVMSTTSTVMSMIATMTPITAVTMIATILLTMKSTSAEIEEETESESDRYPRVITSEFRLEQL